MNRFYERGSKNATEDILDAEEHKKFSHLLGEIKPFTVRTNATLIDAIDIIASRMRTTRTELVQDILIEYLVPAYLDCLEGYYDEFNMGITKEQYFGEMISSLEGNERSIEFIKSHFVKVLND